MVRSFVSSAVPDGKQLLTASADRYLTRAFLDEHLLDTIRCPLSHDGASLSDEGAQQVPNSVTDHVSGLLPREGDGIHKDFISAPNTIPRRFTRTNTAASPTDRTRLRGTLSCASRRPPPVTRSRRRPARAGSAGAPLPGTGSAVWPASPARPRCARLQGGSCSRSVAVLCGAPLVEKNRSQGKKRGVQILCHFSLIYGF